MTQSMLERQNALADRDTTRVTTQNAMNGIKGITDNMVFEKAWSVMKEDDAEMYVDDVRGFVKQGMEVMPAVMAVAKEVGVKGKDLMAAYTRRYK